MNASKSRRLVVFDVEGVLLPERRFLLTAAIKLGFWRFIWVILIGLFYETGFFSLESALGRVFRLFRGTKVDDLFQVYRDIPTINEAEKVFEDLRRAGFKIAIISSGLPTSFVKDLRARLNADYAFGLELDTQDGNLTGKIWGDVLKPEGKALILNKIFKDTGLSQKDCVVVADDRNNLSLFRLCSLRIGYNPDFIISARSDLVLKGNFSLILPLLTGNILKVHSPFLSKNEVFREVIHLSGLLVPIILWFLFPLVDRYLVSFSLLLLAALYTMSEIAKIGGVHFPIISTITRMAASKPELHGIATDPIFFALAIASSIILFPEPICWASIAILVLGDSFAMIFGRLLGRTVYPFNKGKSLEGSVFGLLFAFLGASLFINPAKAFIGATIGMIVECLPTPISDNLIVPLCAGLTLMMI